MQTARVYIDNVCQETAFIPPQLIWSTSAACLGTAIVTKMESLLCPGMSLLVWLRSPTFAFASLIIVFVADRASGNCLFVLMFKAAQLMLLPLVAVLMWLESCGLHAGARIITASLER